MNSSEKMFSLEEVAERLGVQVRTVRSYVRAGRVKAIRIGKQYRVAREDLEAITGPHAWRASSAHRRRAEVSSVVHVDAVSQETADQITTHLLGASKAPREDGSTLRVQTIYDSGRAQIKVIVIGSLSGTAAMFGLLNVILGG
jgi:excisionase family DNA binding protein